MTTSFDFANKMAVIAGGTGSLGSALRNELEARGCTVATVSRAHIADGETDLPSGAFVP